MFETVSVTKILMQALWPQIAERYKCSYVLLIPLPRFKQDYELWKQPYISCSTSIADLIKAYSST